MDSDAIISKYHLDESWTYKGFHAILHTFFPVQETAFHPVRDYFGDSATIVVMYIKEDYMHWYWNTNDMDRLGKLIIGKVNKNPYFLEELLEEWHKRVELFKSEIKKCQKANLSSLTDKELLQLYSDFYNAFIHEFGIAIDLQESFSLNADRFMKPCLSEILSKNNISCEKLEEYYAVLSNPIKESFILTEYRNRLEILKEIREDPRLFKLFKGGKNKVLDDLDSYPHIKSELENHAERFFWIQNNYAKMDALTAGDFVQKICNEIELNPDKEIKCLNERLASIPKEKKEIISKLKISREFQNLIKIAEIFSYMQDERKKYVLISNYFQSLFLEEIGKRLALPKREMDYTIFPELKNMLLDKKFNRKELQDRYNGCLCIMTLQGYELFTGAQAQNVYKKILSPDLESDEIIGSCASKGRATGTVKIVRKTHDLINFKQGDILVASMTRPEMVVAMKKAAAIITDEGGVTSHAAIVSRELGIPCIIGTKIATKILKDGDLVEMDAALGFVKLLKKA